MGCFFLFSIVCCIFIQNNNFQVNFYAETIQLMRKEFYEWPPFYIWTETTRNENYLRLQLYLYIKCEHRLRVIHILFVSFPETEFIFLLSKDCKLVEFKHFLSLGIATGQCKRFDSCK